MRTLFTFQSYAMNQWGIIIHDMILSGGRGNWKERLNALVGMMMVIAGIIATNEARKALYKLIKGGDLPDESIAKQALVAIPEAVPFFGNVISAAWDVNPFGAEPPILKMIIDGFGGVRQFATAEDARMRARGAVRAIESVASLAGVPGTAQISDLIQGAIGEKQTKYRRILDFYEEVKDLSPEERAVRIREEIKADDGFMEVYKQVVSDVRIGVTLDDVKIRNKTVDERAELIAEEIRKNPSQKMDIIRKYARKGIATVEVVAKINKLLRK